MGVVVVCLVGGEFGCWVCLVVGLFVMGFFGLCCGVWCFGIRMFVFLGGWVLVVLFSGVWVSGGFWFMVGFGVGI